MYSRLREMGLRAAKRFNIRERYITRYLHDVECTNINVNRDAILIALLDDISTNVYGPFRFENREVKIRRWEI